MNGNLKHLQLITRIARIVYISRVAKGEKVGKTIYLTIDSLIPDDAIPGEAFGADTFRFSMIRLTRYRSVIGERTKGRR